VRESGGTGESGGAGESGSAEVGTVLYFKIAPKVAVFCHLFSGA
jgi:hypothetical protein